MPTSGNSPKKRKIPAWKSWDECLKYCARKKDNFYSWAFLAESWLGHIIADTLAEYAENKSGSRQLQTGRGREAWQAIYGGIKRVQWGEAYMSFFEYGNCDTPDAEFTDAAWNLAATEDKHGEPVLDCDALNRDSAAGKRVDEVAEYFRFAFLRLADWLEAFVHCRIHRIAAGAPILLQPTPEKRELAQTGLTQAAFADLNQHGKQWWNFRHGELAKQFAGKPEWRLVGKAQSFERFGQLKHPEVDDLAILFWPLLLRYNWTDRDLMGILRQIVSQPDAYPLREDREFADYRKKALGLAKSGEERAKSDPDGRPRGWRVALAMAGKFPPEEFPNK